MSSDSVLGWMCSCFHVLPATVFAPTIFMEEPSSQRHHRHHLHHQQGLPDTDHLDLDRVPKVVSLSAAVESEPAGVTVEYRTPNRSATRRLSV